MILLSSFSLSMVEDYPAKAEFEEVSIDYLKKLVSEDQIVFKIGHPSYASVLSEIFGVKIDAVREKLVFKKGESFVVAQIIADRLAEGKVLTEEEIKKLKIKFVKVSLK
ncbi:MAG TPA: DUF1874 domain-containing protein [Elusimicrobiales bacterium]|nr:DUF1874 domain-containing protein [Elusimicrobiales bacterium]HOL62305.1 DUF1874 domain-containing protein [Elusimicrobiales bacterium]HPO94968.1 DUF1874 domain-containing protein [Elusimicrobiales bacterium]